MRTLIVFFVDGIHGTPYIAAPWILWVMICFTILWVNIVKDCSGFGPTEWGGFKRTAPVLGASAFGTGHFWLIRWLQSGCAHQINYVKTCQNLFFVGGIFFLS